MKWRDLTGPEKKRLFEHIDIPALFPSLENSQKIQKLWIELLKVYLFLQNKARVHKTLTRRGKSKQRCYTVYALSCNACVPISWNVWKYWPVHTTRFGET